MEQLADEKVPAAVKADFLTALAKKGETTGEIAAFARALRDKSISPPLDAETRTREILDVVGTGGDRLSTFNISTTVALLAASAGVLVAKHGNRASTSPIGSADVMEAWGFLLIWGRRTPSVRFAGTISLTSSRPNIIRRSGISFPRASSARNAARPRSSTSSARC